MNNPGTITAAPPSKSGTLLLAAIQATHACLGDGLNDQELAHYLQSISLPVEAGFTFLCYSDRFVTLGVPGQDLADWYPEHGWIAPEKERIARGIGQKHGLSLSEPPDAVFPCVETPNLHHHLELSDRRETVILIHPRYLKIRLFGTCGAVRTARSAQRPLPFGPELLPDLSTLYF